MASKQPLYVGFLTKTFPEYPDTAIAVRRNVG